MFGGSGGGSAAGMACASDMADGCRPVGGRLQSRADLSYHDCDDAWAGPCALASERHRLPRQLRLDGHGTASCACGRTGSAGRVVDTNALLHRADGGTIRNMVGAAKTKP